MIRNPKNGSYVAQFHRATQNQGITPLLINKVKRDATSPTTIVAQNMALVNQANLADFLEGLDSSDHYEPLITKAYVDFECYHSGPGRVRFFIAESFEGATLTDTNGLDTTVDTLMDAAFALEPYEYIPISDWLKFKCVASSCWTVSGRINISKYIKRFMSRSFESPDDRPNLNLIAITNQGAAVGSDIVTFLDVTWTYGQGHGGLKTLA
jgi:hypothetical protein